MNKKDNGLTPLQELGKRSAVDQAAAVESMRKRFAADQAAAVENMCKRWAWASAEATRRLFSGEEDANPEIEELKTQEIRDMVAVFHFIDVMAGMLEDKRVEKSVRVSGMIKSVLDGLNNVAFERFDQWHEVLENSMGPLLARVESERQRENGRKSKRGPSVTGGRQLVCEVRKASGKKKWHTAWCWLVESVDDVAEQVAFTVLAHQDDSITYTIGGRTSSIQKATFQAYWTSSTTEKRQEKISR